MGQVKRHLAPLPPAVMADVLPVSYAEFYRVVKNDPHDWDPTAIFEDKTPVHVGGVRVTLASIISTVCGDINPDAYLLFTKGGDGVPIVRVLLQVTMCPHSRGRASIFTGAPIAQLEDVRLLGPTFVRLPSQAFYVKKGRGPGSRTDGAGLRCRRRRSGEAPGTVQGPG